MRVDARIGARASDLDAEIRPRRDISQIYDTRALEADLADLLPLNHVAVLAGISYDCEVDRETMIRFEKEWKTLSI